MYGELKYEGTSVWELKYEGTSVWGIEVRRDECMGNGSTKGRVYGD